MLGCLRAGGYQRLLACLLACGYQSLPACLCAGGYQSLIACLHCQKLPWAQTERFCCVYAALAQVAIVPIIPVLTHESEANTGEQGK